MKKIDQKMAMKIGIAAILTVVTLLALYGFGWGISAEKNVLLSLASLPDNQKWEVTGNFTLDGEQLENPIIMEFGGQLQLAVTDKKMDSHWKLSGEPFGEVDLFHLANDSKDWLLEVPAVSKEEIWNIPAGESGITQDTIIRWIKELEFQKVGYVSLEREYGGSISCLHVRSDANILPEKMIDWLAKVADKDLPAERKAELQSAINDDLRLAVDCFITPDMKLMEVNVLVGLKGGLSAEIALAARPEKGQVPDFKYYAEKKKVEVDADMLEEVLSVLQTFRQEGNE